LICRIQVRFEPGKTELAFPQVIFKGYSKKAGNSISAITKEVELERMPSEAPLQGSEQPVEHVPK
jgi:hypothetical protein